MCAFSLLSLLGRADASETFGIDQYLSTKGVSEVSVSPDNDYVAYTVTSYDLEEDTTQDAVWIRPTAGGDPLRMSSTTSDASSPLFSPDGRYLAILSDRKDDTTQIWLFDRRGGDAQVLTSLKQGVSSFAWSPDSKRMLIMAEDPSPADLDEEKRPNPRPYVIDRLQFKEDYVGYLDRYRSHIHVIDMLDRKVRQVTFGDFDDSEPAWAPDSRRIVFVSNRTQTPDRNRNTDLWLIDVDAEGMEPQQITEQESADASPSFSPDGKSVVYTSTSAGILPVYAIPQLTVIDLDDKKPTVVEALSEVQVFDPRYSPDGESLYAIAEQTGEQKLVKVDVATGTVDAVVDGEHSVMEFDLGSNGAVYAGVSKAQQPTELFALDSDGLQQLSFENKKALDGISMGKVEKHVYKASDGTELDTYVAFPPDYRKGKKYPGILYIHGGPQAQFDFGFDSETQLLASRGYVVVMPNPRGSFGYGQAFAEAIFQDWGGIDYGDVMSSMDFAIEKGWVDEDRMGVYGWSYGGMMVNHIITKTERFKAAITGASATLYVANYGHDQYQRWWEGELGLPWLEENVEKWNSISPFYKLDKVKTPTLIVGGEHDWNVPIINSEQLYIALKRLDVPTELVIYPEEGHSLSVPSYEKDLYTRYFDWFGRYLKDDKD